jgi:hypothetical protein
MSVALIPFSIALTWHSWVFEFEFIARPNSIAKKSKNPATKAIVSKCSFMIYS